MDFWDFFGTFLDFWDLLGFLQFLDLFRIFGFFLDIFFFFSSKLLRLLLKVNEITTEHQKWPIVSQNSKKNSAGGQSTPQELEVKPA